VRTNGETGSWVWRCQVQSSLVRIHYNRTNIAVIIVYNGVGHEVEQLIQGVKNMWKVSERAEGDIRNISLSNISKFKDVERTFFYSPFVEKWIVLSRSVVWCTVWIVLGWNFTSAVTFPRWPIEFHHDSNLWMLLVSGLTIPWKILQFMRKIYGHSRHHCAIPARRIHKDFP